MSCDITGNEKHITSQLFILAKISNVIMIYIYRDMLWSFVFGFSLSNSRYKIRQSTCSHILFHKPRQAAVPRRFPKKSALPVKEPIMGRVVRPARV